MPKRLSNEKRANIAKLYREGMLIGEIAKYIGCSTSTVQEVRAEWKLADRERAQTNMRSGHKRKKLSDRQVEEIVKCYTQDSISSEKLAKDYNVAGSTIVACLRSRSIDIDRYATRRNNTNVDIELCKNLYESGCSISQIVQKTGYTDSVIIARLKVANVALRPKNGKIIIEDEAVISRYKNGMSIAEIASGLGYSVWCVNRCLLDHGVETRKPSHPARIEQSRANMTKRLEKYQCIRIGHSEWLLIDMLRLKFDQVTPQFQIESGGHFFDAYAGGFLWELDEPRHNHKRQMNLDRKYDLRAKELGYEVRRIKLSDLTVTGVEVWHNYQ